MMIDESATTSPEPSGNSKRIAAPTSFWLNVALSFVFIALGIPIVLWPAFWQFSQNWVPGDSIATIGWAILTLGVVLGLINAFLYYSSSRAKLNSK